jgi:hypothetical protein
MSAINSPINTNSSQTYDDKQLIEEIALGEQKSPKVNIDADYEASKAYSSGVSAEEAAALTAPKLEIPEPDQVELLPEATGDPSQFLAMARDLPTPRGTGNISDELVKKALNID